MPLGISGIEPMVKAMSVFNYLPDQALVNLTLKAFGPIMLLGVAVAILSNPHSHNVKFWSLISLIVSCIFVIPGAIFFVELARTNLGWEGPDVMVVLGYVLLTIATGVSAWAIFRKRVAYRTS